jgi:hypothetical protein
VRAREPNRLALVCKHVEGSPAGWRGVDRGEGVLEASGDYGRLEVTKRGDGDDERWRGSENMLYLMSPM